MTLRAELSSADAKGPYVRRLFHTIAGRYDLITRLLSFGRDRRWKATLIDLARVRPGTRALDLAAGTGDIAFALAERGARVAALDLTHRMLQIAAGKRASLIRGASPLGLPYTLASGGPVPRAARVAPPPGDVTFVTGDMMALPFGDGAFDLVTTGYGIRNVPDIERAIAEIRRVLRPGGLLLSLDFDRPANSLVRAIYLGYLTVVGSALGWVLHRDPDTYRYIPESIRRYPGAAGVAAMLGRAGFADSRVVPLLGGFMAINVAHNLPAEARPEISRERRPGGVRSPDGSF